MGHFIRLVFAFLARAVRLVVGAVGLVTLLVVAAVIGLLPLPDTGPTALPETMVLTVDLEKGLAEGAPASPLGRYALGERTPIEDLVRGLRAAREDPRVVALVVNAGGARMGMGQAEQVRRAVADFRRSGRPTHIFADSFSDTRSYYVAAAFGQIWLQPSGDVGLTGFLAETPFLKDVLTDLGVEPIFSARHEYKTAPEIFTATDHSPAGRAILQTLLDRWTAQVVAGVADGRRLAPEDVRALIDRAPLLAAEAKAAGLVDRIDYHDALTDAVDDETDGAEEVELLDYVDALPAAPETATRVALIHGVGDVQRGESHFSPASSDAEMGSRTLAEAFDAATDDPEVRAILFRIDSPGGDYVAADTIWHAVVRARDKGKLVIASLGDVAASGGYFVAMGADAIVAEPGTITGSIGVFSGKFVLRQFWEKIGVHWDSVQVGANAPMWSHTSGFTPDQRRRFEAMLDAVYADFTAKVADARKLTAAEVDAAARGRVFTGTEALDRKLVDALGGFDTAQDLIRTRLGLAPDAPLAMVAYPEPKSLDEEIMDLLSGKGLPIEVATEARLPATVQSLLRAARPVLDSVNAGADAPAATLRMLPMEVR